MALRRSTRAGGSPVSWRKATRYLEAEVERVVAMLRTVRNPSAPALGEWSVADVAVHLSQAWIAVPGLAKHDLSEVHALLPDTRASGPSLIPDLWDLGEVTKDGVRAERERDLSELADRIEQRARAYLDTHGNKPVGAFQPWLVSGTQVAPLTLTCHLLNETMMHGWDIATADGRRWDIPKAAAALVFDGFLVPAIQSLGPRDMVNQENAAGLHATFEMRVKGGGRHVFAFDDGALSLEAPSDRTVDCIIDADPAALLLVVWGREDQAKAIRQRELVPSGPKAHLAPRLRSLMRNP